MPHPEAEGMTECDAAATHHARAVFARFPRHLPAQVLRSAHSLGSQPHRDA